jgi:hypothetical protein
MENATFEISLTHDSDREHATREQLVRLIEAYDLTPWVRTRRIRVEERAIPHSHPILTFNTRHLDDDDLLLSTFLHEQIHWSLTGNRSALAKALDDIRTLFPNIAVGHPSGADSESSSYLHVIVNFLEWLAMERLVGVDRARHAIDFWCADHYTEIYSLVIRERARLEEVIDRHHLRLADD